MTSVDRVNPIADEPPFNDLAGDPSLSGA